jgi:predicted nucleotidyltransferase
MIKNANEILEELNENLEFKFRNNYTGLILFGSYAKNTQTKKSDLDILITFKSLPKTRLQKIELAEDILNKLEDKHKIAINPIMKEEDKLKMNFLIADISEYAKIITDKNDKIKKIFEKTKNEYKKGHIKKITSGDHYRLYVKNVEI